MAHRVAANGAPENDIGTMVAKLSWTVSFKGQLRLDTRTIRAMVRPISLLAVIILVGVLSVPSIDHIMYNVPPSASASILKLGGYPSLAMGLVNSTTEPHHMSEEIPSWSGFHETDDIDETEKLMLPIRLNGTLPCHNIRTRTVQVLGLPVEQLEHELQEEEQGQQQQQHKERSIIRLEAGKVYEIMIISMGDDGKPRCAGGDYYETDLSGPRWKSRPPVLDNNNGTYSSKLQVDPRFTDLYTFKVVLLFSNFHGLRHHPQNWALREEMVTYEIEFVEPNSKSSIKSGGFGFKPMQLGDDPGVSFESNAAASLGNSSDQQQLEQKKLELHMCGLQDFKRKKWSGRWTRERFNEDCEYDPHGRWQCVDEELQCQKPWCEGLVGSLESNGWVYSAHCAFKIFQKEEAWKCLDGKWLFFWGDSNHMDTIRNLLNFVLGFNQQVQFLHRRMDMTFSSLPDNESSVRITSMFNGHANVTMNNQGLFSLYDRAFAEQLRSYFTGEAAPDFMIMNSGVHDGMYWKSVERFLREGVDFAAEFWADVWNNMRARKPHILYRTTVAAAGRGRSFAYNPHKMEVFNQLMVDRFLKLKLERFHVIDGFDYTFPWHWDHKASDGPHYGRPPSKTKWAGDNVGHRYFVDLMLVHMLLNAICAPKT